MESLIEIVDWKGNVIREYRGLFCEAYNEYWTCSEAERVWFNNIQMCDYNLTQG